VDNLREHAEFASFLLINPMIWDIFCRVIDNHGDLGVSWRLGCQLANAGHSVRLWIDKPADLVWMAPKGNPGVEVFTWTHPLQVQSLLPGDVLIEAFGCEIAPEFIASYQNWIKQKSQKCIWINLEYLSAQAYVERNHGLPSPVLHGAGFGLVKYFFYPGLTAKTGGLLREPDLATRQSCFDPHAWLAQWGISDPSEQLISLFCYEPATLAELLEQLESSTQPSRLLVCAGRSAHALRQVLLEKKPHSSIFSKHSSLSITYLPYLSQIDFDHLLWACDLNLVRGEDSLVRAIWAGKPWVWQIYPQHDDAHQDKLEQLLASIEAPESLRSFHRSWNALTQRELPLMQLPEWEVFALACRSKLWTQTDLASRLQAFVKSIQTSED
jgi:uncharacterized repeat protein (TIGR03837 family)